jgi:oligopeptide/dipeptide ABC transporter ATP-binding protein
MTATPILEIDRLSVEFRLGGRRVRALSDISFAICRGEILGLVGESGCGKSLTSLAIMRLLPRNAAIAGGRILLEGRDLVVIPEAEMRTLRGNAVSMIFQEPMVALNPLATIGRQIEESLLIHRAMSQDARTQRALELLALVGMPDPRERHRQYPHQLSGGMGQRAMIAMALACEPGLIIADEPTTALDATIQAQILDLLREIRERLGTAILFITHNMGVIADIADRVAVMYAGQVVETAAVERLFAAPAHPYTAALLRSIPDLGSDRRERLPSIAGRVPPLGAIPSACTFQDRCPFVTAVCREERPLLEDVAPGHQAACWHPLAAATAMEVR